MCLPTVFHPSPSTHFSPDLFTCSVTELVVGVLREMLSLQMEVFIVPFFFKVSDNNKSWIFSLATTFLWQF
jgi:hypothetical protein